MRPELAPLSRLLPGARESAVRDAPTLTPTPSPNPKPSPNPTPTPTPTPNQVRDAPPPPRLRSAYPNTAYPNAPPPQPPLQLAYDGQCIEIAATTSAIT